ncbi:hypothetical protein SISNIDRAFT_491407 [Sistotremastrum niveocremeum HHB9708]|uniref:Uncharacterized protein n=1 Tax=Sistotremastrum niveocremeum HHB9708 TaxID=1314777 RepID=A0A164MUV7_9AGAM|nr:hypothetical protein SISNIDRAFT_491407 [Sistotremastrum niveocremeum HHB9708]
MSSGSLALPSAAASRPTRIFLPRLSKRRSEIPGSRLLEDYTGLNSSGMQVLESTQQFRAKPVRSLDPPSLRLSDENIGPHFPVDSDPQPGDTAGGGPVLLPGVPIISVDESITATPLQDPNEQVGLSNYPYTAGVDIGGLRPIRQDDATSDREEIQLIDGPDCLLSPEKDRVVLLLTESTAMSMIKHIQSVYPSLYDAGSHDRIVLGTNRPRPSEKLPRPPSSSAHSIPRQSPSRLPRHIRSGIPWALWRESGCPDITANIVSGSLQPLDTDGASIGDIYELQYGTATPAMWVMCKDTSDNLTVGVWTKAGLGTAHPHNDEYVLHMRRDGSGPTWIKRETVRKYKKNGLE